MTPTEILLTIAAMIVGAWLFGVAYAAGVDTWFKITGKKDWWK